MNSSQLTLSQQEIAEIEQHKYFMSEKAGYDVGWECAEQDWRERFVGETQTSNTTDDAPQKQPGSAPPPKGLGRFFKRLISKAAV